MSSGRPLEMLPPRAQLAATELRGRQRHMRCAVLVLALAARGDALLGPLLSARAAAPLAVRQVAHVRPSLRGAPHQRKALMMAVRTEAQRAAYSGAMDTTDLKDAIAKSKATRVLAAVTAVLCAVAVVPGPAKARVKALVGSKVPVVKALALQACLTVRNLFWSLLTAPAVQSLAHRVLTRLIDYGVPAAVLLIFFMVGEGGEDSGQEEEAGLLKKLLKGGSPKSSGYAPAKQYISVKSLGERLRSMEYTVTASTAEAARTLRRHDLARRFGDELGDIGTTALAGIVQAEEGWRKKAAAPAEAAAKARAELRAISVKLGGVRVSPRRG